MLVLGLFFGMQKLGLAWLAEQKAQLSLPKSRLGGNTTSKWHLWSQNDISKENLNVELKTTFFLITLLQSFTPTNKYLVINFLDYRGCIKFTFYDPVKSHYSISNLQVSTYRIISILKSAKNWWSIY